MKIQKQTEDEWRSRIKKEKKDEEKKSGRRGIEKKVKRDENKVQDGKTQRRRKR